ncbi:hypothetical protein [Mycolicibacter kumamotonensis]|uniref:Uncharacterized protein n=1 Tax=Mycolicibacter kumamotonensis TaxID=354243 RepID=A0A1B8SD73_9MYCO|nr:hypothetical protein [Mycolicibacter kumamotonensis]OBY30652.1 hypothetical protein ACT18_16325 [Mycolicibacter kumamotonensis]
MRVEEPAHQAHLLEAAQRRPVETIKALNFRLIFFAEAVLNAAQAWDAAMRADEELQSRCVSNYSKVPFQMFNRIPRPKT